MHGEHVWSMAPFRVCAKEVHNLPVTPFGQNFSLLLYIQLKNNQLQGTKIFTLLTSMASQLPRNFQPVRGVLPSDVLA